MRTALFCSVVLLDSTAAWTSLGSLPSSSSSSSSSSSLSFHGSFSSSSSSAAAAAAKWSSSSRRRPYSQLSRRFGELEDELNAAFEKQRQERAVEERPKPAGIALQDGAVPQEQQPAQELKDLQEAPVFGWAQLSDEEFISRLKYLFGGVWLLVSLPISAVSFPLDQAPFQAILAANFGTLAFLTVLMLRLYSGWSYVAERLTTDVGYYEQSGWYDGFLSVKPAEIRQRDQLLFEFEVEPALQRVKNYGAVTAAACVASFLLFRLASPDSP
jgi:hypothetical protein